MPGHDTLRGTAMSRFRAHQKDVSQQMNRQKVLFVCVHNGGRSQMAEAWLNHLCADRFAAESAGLEPGALDPLVVEVMREAGIDISHKKTRAVDDVLKAGTPFAYVVTVCDETSAEQCPIFPGEAKQLHWSFPDPAALTGTREERLAQVRAIRDTIKKRIEAWCAETACTDHPSR